MLTELGGISQFSIPSPQEDLISIGNFASVKRGIADDFKSDEPVSVMRWSGVLIGSRTETCQHSTSEVLVYAERDGWKPAKFVHLVSFATQYPKVQKFYQIVGLGSKVVWEVPCFPTLGLKDGKRKLGLRSDNFDWPSGTVFLFVKPYRE